MKSKKAKIKKNPSKKSETRIAKKELETSITDKFLEVIRGFGHGAENFSKDVRKLSKSLAKKLVDKVSSVKGKADKPAKSLKKQADMPETVAKRAVRAPREGVARAEKVAVQAAGTSKKTASPARAVARTSGGTKPKTAAVSNRKSSPSQANGEKTSNAKPAATRKTPVKTDASKSSGLSSVAPTVRKPRIKRVAPEKQPALPQENINQPEDPSAGFDRTNNNETL